MKKAIAIGLSLLITGVVSWFLLKSVPSSAFVDAFSHVSIYAIFVGFVMAVAMAVIDGVRYWELLRRKTTIDHMTSVACLHNMLINVMPARTGDLSFPYFAHRFGVPLGAGIGSLVVARVFDVFALATLLFAGAWLVPGTALFAQAKVPMLITTGILLLVLILIVLFRHAAHIVVHKIANATRVSQHTVGQWLLQKFEEILHSLDVLKSPTSLFIVYMCSVANWLAQCVITLVLTQALGLPLSFAHIMLAVALVNVISALPIQGFAGFGTVEAIWAGVLAGLGIPFAAGVAAGLLIHVANLLYTAIVGVYGGIRVSQIQKRG